jgi:hypothetical protein
MKKSYFYLKIGKKLEKPDLYAFFNAIFDDFFGLFSLESAIDKLQIELSGYRNSTNLKFFA